MQKSILIISSDKLDADGFTLVQNNGIAQDVKHFHLHVIPKYRKKVNLHLDDVYKKLSQ